MPRTPGEGLLGASRTSRAERRRDGQLPQSEDPLLRRPADRPTGPPPGGGRRRSDAEPLSAGHDVRSAGRGPLAVGRDAVSGRDPVPGGHDGMPTGRAGTSAGWDGTSTGREAGRMPEPRPSLPVSGPMTSVASTVPPRASARPTPPRVSPATGPAARRPEADRPGSTAVPQRPAGVSGWPAEAAAPAPAIPDVTQRVTGAAPAGSAWDAMAAAAAMTPQSAPPRAPQTPPRAAGARPAPADAVPPSRPLPGRPTADRPGVDRPSAGRLVRDRRDDDGPATDETALVATVDETMVASRRAVDVPVGGRAAARLERQAAEAAARKSAGRRTAPPATPAGSRGPGREDDVDTPGAPRRAVQGVLGVVVIALVVLGVWSFTSPQTSEIAAQTTVPSAPASAAPLPPPALPSLAPVTSEVPPPPAPVKAPITVLNSTNVTGLAGRIGDAFTAGGWEVLGTGAYPGDDVAATTVFYTEGDAEQEQAALQLVEQFGADVTGPVARFFDVPEVADPGIVVVATGNWRP
ncbi:LytR C-terminal domain-containing protein [Modestobacter sp. VKM Ac-2986]|uniref:LytR C-terminal domain-containing protein n=1 Tax=Modestobacter sp. VKM Ac-2986 TaxID=3004140 RepID=UPI0022ABA7F0|nr:LytR C-terminal domain-containing protein [Modestobacter sp. VKM Ac-2986]MCZ2830096.1 LytR C-terminal domain-containing protein [Modestobacter sp. VKM Ac-2986]